MKKIWQLFIGMLLLLTLFCGVGAVYAQAEWTVLLYMCGTDLESAHGNASSYLAEVAETRPNASVNLVVETGGAKEWHSQDVLGFQISNTMLERYYFNEKGYTRVGELPPASMGNPDTLTDFIRWGTENYPAEKYMLVLWDHGDGINMLFDEVYYDFMQSYEIGDAMRAAGTQFEVFLVDACLMSTLEIASAVAPSAHYMIASQEITIGLDAAFTEWMQYLYDAPYVDGSLFARYVCDTTQEKLNYNYSGKTLTWAVTDLTKIDAVKAAFADFVKEMAALLPDAKKYRLFDYYTNQVDNYGSYMSMYDLGSFANRAKNVGISNETILKLNNAIMEAVVYQVKGYNRVYAHGLSFFYDRAATPAQLNEYAKNCPVPEYLAFLDTIFPNWEYDTGSISFGELDPAQYHIESHVSCQNNGAHLQLSIINGKNAISSVDYDLYQYDEKTGKLIYLGTDNDISHDYQNGVFIDQWDGRWPGYDGIQLEIDLVDKDSTSFWYNVPVILYDSLEDYDPNAAITQAQIYYLQVELINDPHNSESSYYRINGIWNGNTLQEENTFSLDSLKGHYLSILRKVVDSSDENWMYREHYTYLQSKPIEVNDEILVQRNALPDGIYYFVFTIKDVFGRRTATEPAIAEYRNGRLSFSCPQEVSQEYQFREKMMPLTTDNLYFFK